MLTLNFAKYTAWYWGDDEDFFDDEGFEEECLEDLEDECFDDFQEDMMVKEDGAMRRKNKLIPVLGGFGMERGESRWTGSHRRFC